MVWFIVFKNPSIALRFHTRDLHPQNLLFARTASFTGAESVGSSLWNEVIEAPEEAGKNNCF